MQTDDGIAPQPGPKKPGRPKGSVGPHPATRRLGDQVIDHLADGTPKSYLVEAWYSRAPWRRDDDPEGVAVALRVIGKRLSNAREAALAARGLPVTGLPTSPAVGKALRRFHAQSAEHREHWLHLEFEGPEQLLRTAPPEYWASLASRIELHIALVKAMALASGQDKTAVLAALEAKHVFARARATSG